jgi:hypothetical protein
MADPGAGEVRRADDGELLGSVVATDDGRWAALAVFGGMLAIRATAADARAVVESEGLASLARRWFFRASPDDAWSVVVIQEAWPGRAIVVDGPYALAGMPTFELTAADLAAGHEMTLEPPDEDLAQFARDAPDVNGPEPSRDDGPGPPRSPR